MTLLAAQSLLRVATDEDLTPAELSEKIEACGEPGSQSWLCARVYDLTRNVGAAETANGLSSLFNALVILAIAFALNRVVHWIIKRVVRRVYTERGSPLQSLSRRTGLSALESSRQVPVTRRLQRAETLQAGLRSIASIIIWIVGSLLALSALGFDLGPLLAGAGLLGIVVGFGAQEVVRDFLSGLFMIFEDEFGVGDIIDTGFAVGTVEAVTLRVTRVRDVDGVVWHVPNGRMERVGNLSQEWARAVLDVDVAYDTDVAKARDVILETARALAHDPEWGRLVLAEPEVWGVQDFGIDAISIRLVVKTRPLEQWAVARELRFRLKHALDDAGIEIPFPQRTVWLRSEPGVEEGAGEGRRRPAPPERGRARRAPAGSGPPPTTSEFPTVPPEEDDGPVDERAGTDGGPRRDPRT